MKGQRRRMGLILLMLPFVGLLFWFTAVWTSNLPDTIVLAVNVHGLTLNPPTGGQRPAPLSLSVLADAQQDAATPTPDPNSYPATAPGTSASSNPSTRHTATPSAPPTPSPTPSLTPVPTPSLTPLPTPIPTTPSATPTPGSATIAGQVVDSQTHLPIPGATVSLNPGGNSTSTDSNGNFSVSVAPNTYGVTASAATYNSATQSVTVKAGQRVSLSFKLTSVTAYGSLAGTVTDSVTQGPIVGAKVTLSNGLARVTDLNGSFSFSIVLTGTYTMTVSALGYTAQSQQVTIRAGKTTNVQIALN